MSATWVFGTYTRSMADEYFLLSPQYPIWNAFSELMRTQCVSEAERLIWAYLGGWDNLQHPDDILTKQRIRHDYAIYEQALYLAQTSGAIANGEQTTPKWMANQEDVESEKKFEEPSFPVKISQRSKFWLGQQSYNPRLGRG